MLRSFVRHLKIILLNSTPTFWCASDLACAHLIWLASDRTKALSFQRLSFDDHHISSFFDISSNYAMIVTPSCMENICSQNLETSVVMVELLDLKLLIGLSTELNFEQRPTEDFARSRLVCFTKHLVFQKL